MHLILKIIGCWVGVSFVAGAIYAWLGYRYNKAKVASKLNCSRSEGSREMSLARLEKVA